MSKLVLNSKGHFEIQSGTDGGPLDGLSITTVSDYPYSASVGTHIDASGDGGIILLPDEPSSGEQIEITNASTGTVTVQSALPINDDDGDYIMSQGETLTLYVSSDGWRIR